MIDRRRAMTVAAVLIALTILPPSSWSQGLPRDAAKAGFSAASGKRVASFEVTSLSGSPLRSDVLHGTPTLFHVWSIRDDPTGEGPALAAALAEALRGTRPGMAVIVLSADKAERIASVVAGSGLDPSAAAGDARAAIRALGSPSAPAWLFVAPTGEIVAYRLGRLPSGLALKAAESLFALYPAAVSDAIGPKGGDASVSVEERVLAELNLARTNPAAYIEVLKEYRTYIRGSYLERPGETTVVLSEGARAVDEAIAFLSRQAALPPLTLSAGLSRAAADHAADQCKTGRTGHTGSDRSTMKARVERYGEWSRTIGENIAYGAETARDVVIQLIVDDGVASRGHRANIFNPGFTVVGIAFGEHPVYRTVCVQDFAGGYDER